ncbi:phage head-tail adapter protein [Serratia sp. Ag1]|nr:MULTISPECIES: gpW family head-tail joining protein [unclassified Serratia (in: enterobacteria)]KFK94582.1 phage head-tail adapter protein [Serratia sp. Ag2]KFK95802.1 phage head-tail adapter protein [Serratia sp. Ag1]
MSTLTGIPADRLRAMLEEAQQAKFDIMMGKRGISYSYTQGDGTRSVTYQQANIDQLNELIAEIQTALGIGRRRAVRFRW